MKKHRRSITVYNTLSQNMMRRLALNNMLYLQDRLSKDSTGVTAVPGDVDEEETLSRAGILYGLEICGFIFQKKEWKAIIRTSYYTRGVYSLKHIFIASTKKVYIQVDADELGLSGYQNIVLFSL